MLRLDWPTKLMITYQRTKMGTETEMAMCAYLYTYFPLCLLLLLPVLLLIVAGDYKFTTSWRHFVSYILYTCCYYVITRGGQYNQPPCIEWAIVSCHRKCLGTR